MTDLELLRTYEPILRFTRGELFFPMAAERYVEQCDLWAGSSQTDRDLVVPLGSLRIDDLADLQDREAIRNLYLRFVQRPLNGLELTRWNQRPDRPAFRAPGRLARVGIFARLVDAALSVSLLFRGSVPGGTAAAAQVKYEAIRNDDSRVVYHGRVLRRAGWIVLQYLFFYAMNDWRSTFNGANDHEADWEQLFVVLEDRGDEEPRAVWFAAAAHDEKGDDLRRRWDDPTVTRVGEHLVVHPGAGSHADYFEPGEYLMAFPPPGFRFVRGVLQAARAFWTETLRQPDPGDVAARVLRTFQIPFVDYGRGDGFSVGPGQDAEWSPIVIDDDTPWVRGYRGLWGLDTEDRFAGERAPAGPKFNRSGMVRQTWEDPLGWMGLEKVAPPGRASAVMEERIAELEQERTSLATEIAERSATMPRLAAELEALQRSGSPDAMQKAQAAVVAAAEVDLVRQRAQNAELDETLAASRAELARLRRGDFGDPRAHLRHVLSPESSSDIRFSILTEAWAALSVGILILFAAGALFFNVLPLPITVLVVVVAYLLLEAMFRRRLLSVLYALTVVLAMIGALLLAVEYIRELVFAGVLAVAAVILLDNVRELRRSLRH